MEKIYFFIHKIVVPILHATLWILAYYGREKFFTTSEDVLWKPVVDVSIICVVFFMEIVITLFDVFFENSKRAASMSIFIPFAVFVGLLTASLALVALYLVNLTEENSATGFLSAIIFVSAGAKFMEIWLQNNVSFFIENYITLRDSAYIPHYQG